MSKQSISRVLFPEGITPIGTMIIHLVSKLPARSSDLPGNSGGPPSIVPLFGFAPDGVCIATDVTTGAGELLPRHFTLTSTRPRGQHGGGFFSVALSFPSPGLGVTQHPVLWSPDFPLPCFLQGGDHSSCFDIKSTLEQRHPFSGPSW
jgi:hypothetical protein